MKKAIAFILALSFIVGSLCSCSPKTEDGNDSSNFSSTQSENIGSSSNEEISSDGNETGDNTSSESSENISSSDPSSDDSSNTDDPSSNESSSSSSPSSSSPSSSENSSDTSSGNENYDEPVNDSSAKVDNVIDSNYTDSVLGASITLKALTGGAETLVNNSGMSGLWSGNHLHAAFDSSTSKGRSYITENMYSSSTPVDIVFDAGSVQMLGKMFIWNYNDISALDCGIKSVDVFYSTNGVTWSRLDRYVLAKCTAADNNKYGGNISTNINGTNMPIDFGGIPARYIKLKPLTNWGGNKFGLSEVRVFRHKESPGVNDLIYSDAFAPQSDLSSISLADNAVNNSGMSTVQNNSNATHSNSAEDMWLCLDSADNSVLIIDLDGNYPVSSVTLWNYNAAGATSYGIRTFDIYYSVNSPYETKQNQGSGQADSLNWNGSEKNTDWSKIGGTYTLSIGTGKNGLSSSITINFENVHAQFIKIVPKTNWGGTSSGFGLSEVRINAGKGWMIEPSRYWTGVLSSSGSFAYQGNTGDDPFAKSGEAGSGWIGGDGCFSTSLTNDNLQGEINDNSKTFVTFQDSFIGRFGNYRKFTFTQGYAYSSNFHIGMKNMAYLFINGDDPDVRNVQFEHQLDVSNNHSLGNIFPNNSFGTGYWTGDSTFIDGKLYSVATCIQDGWGTNFRWILSHELGTDGFPNMSKIPSVVLKHSTVETVNDNSYPVGAIRSFSNEYFSMDQMYEEGDYIYMYGKMNGTGWLDEGQYIMLARVRKSNLANLNGIEYWNGSNWTLNMKSAAAISDFAAGNEFNVTYCTSGPFKGKYVAVYTDGSIGGSVCIGVSDSITGMFTRPSEYRLYYAPERYRVAYESYTQEAYAADTTSNKASYYTILSQWNYNAKSQPALSKEGELLITYHFGTHDDRTPSWGFFGAVNKEYEHPTFISLKSTEDN